MVAYLGAVQGQEYAQTKWGLGLRLPNLNDYDIEQELTDGKILRTHILRPTWHFVSAHDINWLLTLTAPRVHSVNSFMYRKLELDETLFKICNNIIAKALYGGKHLTREELNTQLKKNKIKAEGHRLSYIMMQAELNGLICSGIRRGNQFTYALLEERVPNSRIKNKEEALAELSKRYFKSRGPATIKDFSTWSGLTIGECKEGLSLVESNFIKKKLGDEEFIFPHNSLADYKNPYEIYLLPVYDEFIMGYKNREAILEFRNSINPVPVFRFDSMIIFEGQIIGTWKRTIKSKLIELEYNFFKPLNKNRKGLFIKAIDRFGEFNNLPVKAIHRA